MLYREIYSVGFFNVKISGAYSRANIQLSRVCDTAGSSDYVVSNVKVVSEWCVEEDVEARGHVLIWGRIPEIARQTE